MERFHYRWFNPDTDMAALYDLCAPEMADMLPNATITREIFAQALAEDPWQAHMAEHSNRELLVVGAEDGSVIDAFADGVLFPGARGVRVLLNSFVCRDPQAMEKMFNVLAYRSRSMGCGLLYYYGKHTLGMGWQGHPEQLTRTFRCLQGVGFQPAGPKQRVITLPTTHLSPTKEARVEWTQADANWQVSIVVDDEAVARCEAWRMPGWLQAAGYQQWAVINTTQEINDRPGEQWGREVVLHMAQHLSTQGITTLVNSVPVEREAFWLELGTPLMTTRALERPLPM